MSAAFNSLQDHGESAELRQAVKPVVHDTTASNDSLVDPRDGCCRHCPRHTCVDAPHSFSSMSIFKSIRHWASRIKRDAVTLWFAYRHSGTPWFAKALAAFVVAYALSPIDLIPDFIPVLGYLDDALLLPGLIWLNIRLIPADVLEECRARADKWMKEQGAKPRSIAGAVLVLAIWIAVGTALWAWFTTRN
ncbi:uncharacterized membrane protein YkvA (DUF1232 family) [Variovorax paradoxus]|nr:uncharacterized membrane protein YkvA (DUF1232 family) [Variovorax paradoxus]